MISLIFTISFVALTSSEDSLKGKLSDGISGGFLFWIIFGLGLIEGGMLIGIHNICMRIMGYITIGLWILTVLYIIVGVTLSRRKYEK